MAHKQRFPQKARRNISAGNYLKRNFRNVFGDVKTTLKLGGILR
jgi:hypothetical protein